MFKEKDYRLQFLVDQKNESIRREEELSFAAGKLVDKLYEALLPQYKGQDEKSLRSLNILCVRIVFCLYAEDAGLFDTRTAFEDYIKGFNLPNVRMGLMNLFKALDTPLEKRDEYDESLRPFPYVNGGLFKDENIEIPNFTQEIVDVIVNDCAPFNWSEISPTIFGAVFESTLNPETRRKGGMHYTSIQNIHKVIDPLFMDELKAEFDAICQTKAARQKTEKLLAFQEKLGSLTFLDPACGSGNFLTETYLSLRRLENEVIKLRYGGQNLMGVFENPVKVRISQFYGIEINDFAVTVAKTALWIAESQMIAETEASTSAPTVKLADRPTRFHVENFPKGNYIVIPEVSSEKRKYIPIGFLTPDIFCSNLVKIVPDATLYHFGVLTSNVHNAWMRMVAGRLEMRYRYSKDIVYNNFPWPEVTGDQKASIEKSAQAILDARAKYADCTLAQLYGDKSYLFPELMAAHRENDKAVMAAYGFALKMSESECVAELFKLYEKLALNPS